MAERQNNSMRGAIDSEEMKRYLFFESSEAERAAVEEKFFEADELFYEMIDLENDLTDGYAQNALDENDRKRFAASLEKSLERRAKLASAKTLQVFIAEEIKASAPLEIEPVNDGFWEKVKSFFSFNAVKFQYAAAVLLIIMLFGTAFLLYERQRDSHELARIREIENQRSVEIEQKEKILQEQIEAIQEREQNLQNKLFESRGQTEILTERLTLEQTEKTRIERELEILKRQKSARSTDNQPPSAPLIATVILAPIGGKGGGDDAETISPNKNTTIVSATLQIPKDSTAEIFNVSLNSAPLAANIKSNQTKSGSKFIRVSFSTAKLAFDQENLLSVTAKDGSRYNYVLRRRR